MDSIKGAQTMTTHIGDTTGVRGIQSDDDNELDNLLSCGDETVTLFSSRKFS